MGGKHADPVHTGTPRSAVRRWVSGLGVSQIRTIVVVAILAATAAFGGLDTVAKTATTFKPGEAFSDGQFTVTLERAVLVSSIKAGTRTVAPEKPGRRYLGIVAGVTNDSTVPGTLTDELDVRGLPDLEPVGAMRLTDGMPVGFLGPGLTEQVAFIWEMPADALRDGDTVTVRIWQKQYHELLVTYGKAWLDSLTDYGQAEIPLQEKS